ncbi:MULTISPECIES: TetR/AcrR family transcriptional regulator [unclassified Novosphingobium]|uniref:TetR/AcrR family transcriptional regulator n=1 Tax=unclassified Novosphingobium TaxID=2644732 RepID=UPI0025F396C9|nr:MULTISPECIES: TetR/AcrR family transcriptional regulator [unclassified Novosphingobium]HQS68539.1 TetR/AcrR family transcriptional regulator [Novosphingobium sp.]
MNTETNKRERPRGEHRTSAANRQKILEATLQVAQEYGYQGTTIPRVSLKAQLPTGSVYWHFESKDILFASLMDQSREWLEGFHRKRRPLPGETTRQHLERIYCNAPENEALITQDFWRLGVILSVDQSVREQLSRQRFLDLRQAVIDEYTAWYRQTLPAEIQERCPNRALQMGKFTLVCADGNLIMNASGGTLPGYLRMAGISLIALATSPPDAF